MESAWTTETGHLARRWSGVGERGQYNPTWMQEATEMKSGYLTPIPDFASHSPFGGATWFEPSSRNRDSE